MLGKTKHLHFVGIGGIGMSGIAELLLNLDYKITGSDIRQTEITEHLSQTGAKIFYQHSADNVGNPEVVVKSSAVTDDNVEIRYALENKIPVIRRAEMLSELMRMKYGIAIAGTHGKTTTTSMTGMVLTQGGLDPTVIVGGKVKNFASNSKLGNSEYIIVEADEFDKSFLSLTPIIAGITNIEADHLDCYPNLAEIKNAFIQYANTVPFFGLIVVCYDNHGIRSIIPKLKKRLITYGTSEQAEVQAVNIRLANFQSDFQVKYKNRILGGIHLNLPGIHNVRNSLLAIIIGLELEIPFDKIALGLQKFTGVYRRFEKKGEVNGILVFDDYAHHPTEIIASLQGIKESTNRRIVAVFQPHLYTRTRDFYEDFGKSLLLSDILIVTDIYPAREKPIKNISGKLVADAACKNGHKFVYYIQDKDDVPQELMKLTKSGDIVITLGAGDIFKYGEKFIELNNG